MSNFVTAINCMDGRTQLPVIDFLKNNYNAKFVDNITEPGPIKYLEMRENCELLESFKRRLDISVKKHGSNLIAIVAHYDCAGNPLPKEKQLVQLQKSCDFIKGMYPTVEVIGIWVNDEWKVEEVYKL